MAVKGNFKNFKGEEFEQVIIRKILSEKEAKHIYDKIGNIGTVTSIKEVIRPIKPPIPFNTTSLIVAANSIGFTAQKQ